ncbi:hypothetical protein PR048_013948 [Dryococelus australis]|uniref:Protein kinase domain-containing protein n=1 Tax=Dryococelus australis TaxID=614101 RepID=A0ABQ9HTK9_9NEOP|nr:hypothetical protein PR048_013948 [Dryococelus australis]
MQSYPLNSNFPSFHTSVNNATLDAVTSRAASLVMNLTFFLTAGKRFSHVGIVPDAGRWVFSGMSRFPIPYILVLLRTHLISLSFALKVSKSCRGSSWPPPHLLDFQRTTTLCELLTKTPEVTARTVSSTVSPRCRIAVVGLSSVIRPPPPHSNSALASYSLPLGSPRVDAWLSFNCPPLSNSRLVVKLSLGYDAPFLHQNHTELLNGSCRYGMIHIAALEVNIDLEKLPSNLAYHRTGAQLNPKLEKLEFPRNDIIYIRDLGQGAFGRVFQVQAACRAGSGCVLLQSSYLEAGVGGCFKIRSIPYNLEYYLLPTHFVEESACSRIAVLVLARRVMDGLQRCCLIEGLLRSGGESNPRVI